MDGNSTSVEPVMTGAPNGQAPEPQGQDAVETLKGEITKLKEQYSNSSREAHKLVDELKQEREARLRLEGSLKSQQNAQRDQFPDEEGYVKYWTELGQDEKIARAEFREKKINYDNQKLLHQQIMAQSKYIEFMKAENETGWRETNPDAQKAIEQFKGIPELEALPVGEKIKRYRELQTRFGVKTEGRDTTAIKQAASGATGNGSRPVDTAMTNDAELKAKEAGFSCAKEMSEMNACQSNQDFNEWRKRWKR
jgi:hypothetical protein